MFNAQRQQGSVLTTVLLFLLLITLLGLGAANTGILEKKMTQATLLRGQVLQTAEAGLRAGEKALHNQLLTNLQQHTALKASVCEYPAHTANDFVQRNAQWWQSAASCHGKLGQFKYDYVIEDLHVQGCVQVKTTNPLYEHTEATQFYRITARASADKQHAIVVLQSTYALPAAATQPCVSQVQAIQLGRQSWNEWRDIS